MRVYQSAFWEKAPFVKLLLATICGILLQWRLQVSLNTWWFILFGTFISTLCFFWVPVFKRFKLGFLNGILISVIFLTVGGMLAWQKDIRNNSQWINNYYQEKDAVVATLDEPLAEKTKSLKAKATVSYILQNSIPVPVKAKIILYFKKGPLPELRYGSQIIFKKSLQEIKNSGNPGGFDYKRYCLFQGITHQVYLKEGEFEIVKQKKGNWLRKFIYLSREKILDILRTYIKGDKEAGLAEALLIGYKDDLEPSLVRSYTNTGVVHIIAISGLHLGLIYWLLAILLKPLQKQKRIRWLRPVLIIGSLWAFSLLAGAQPSILRSAIMFTCIVLGESLSRKTSIYNTMAVSAFILLCINPYWLWDAGFQLSYAAVLSIIIFMRPVYSWFYIQNKILDFIWKMNAVTLAAQVLTVPLSIYHFHQFPVLFMLTNFIAVPLSSAILLGEIFLCAIFFLPSVALFTGKLIAGLIWIMNTYIEKIEAIPFSLLDSLQINNWQTILLFLFITGCSYWLFEKSINGLKWGLSGLFCFVILRSYSFIQVSRQQKIIVYNIAQKRAIDFIEGRSYFFVGDSDLLSNNFDRNFHLKPSRVLYRIKKSPGLENLWVAGNYFDYAGKRILLLSETTSYLPGGSKPVIDLLVISKNPKIYIQKLVERLTIKQVVFDGSVPAWKTNYWKKDCDSLHIPWYDVSTKGAFVMKLR